MKKLLPTFLAVAGMAGVCADVEAYSFKIGELYYDLDDTRKTAQVAPANREEGATQGQYVKGALTIPESVIFAGETYTVTGIGSKAFANCVYLASVDIPATVVSIGFSAFAECDDLVSVTIPSSVTYMGSGAFMECRKLTTIDWPSGLKVIPERAFEGSALTTFTVPSTVTSIGERAFKDCKKLTDIYIPRSARNIGNAILEGCGIDHPVYNDGMFYYCPESMAGRYEIPEGIGVIAGQAFYYCQKLTEVVVPESVKESGYAPFKGCYGLKKPVHNSKLFLAMPVNTGDKSYIVPDGITRIMPGAFEGCYRLEDVTLPEGLREIGKNSFRGCRRLKGISMPNTVIDAGLFAFQNCEKLEWVNISEGLKMLDGYLFDGCESLREAEIPDGIHRIEFNVFSGCRSLEKVTIGEGVTEIGASCFDGCTALNKIVALPHYPAECLLNSIDDLDPFTGVDKYTCELWVKSESLDYYEGVPIWRDFYNKRAIESGVETTATGETANGVRGCYDINGMRLPLREDASSGPAEALPHGLYIVNGRKVLK